MHGGGKAGAFVTEEKVRSTLTGMLSAEALQKFIEAVRNRGGLLEERVELFQFAHLTFQEFLAARAIAKQRKDGLPLLQPHLADAWWREVALLTYGFAQQDYEPFAREFLEWLSNQGLVGLELAGAAMLELERPNPELRTAQANRLSAALTNPTSRSRAAGSTRGRSGRVLAELGDPRPHVLDADAMHLCYVPPGEFIMGSNRYDDEMPEHVQRVKDGFWIGRYPVTQAQFGQFVAAEGYKNKDYWPEAIAAKRWADGRFHDWNNDWRDQPVRYGGAYMLPNHPVVGVSWYEAMAFCHWLNGLNAVLPARETGGAGAGAGGGGGGARTLHFRLPTEAEWEYAARGPRFVRAIPRDSLLIRAANAVSRVSHTDIETLQAAIKHQKFKIENRRAYPWGGDPDTERMNYIGTGIGSTSAVGAFPLGSSLFGCEDMSGNVWEWTMTKWKGNYENYDQNVKNQPDGSGAARVIRGGAFSYDDRPARCAYRNYDRPHDHYGSYGFRLVASPIF
jgi:formylglycine-generating enzyme required for sulfatase activity